jgi:CheY-like chemotaxis protein
VSEANGTILLIEDDPNDVLLVQRAFRRATVGNPIQVVGDGEAAVDYMAGHGHYQDRQSHPLPAIMLLDLKLPRRSGFEVLEWLRRQPRLRRIPVVVLTSSALASDIRQAYELGANSYLVKPLEFEALQDMLRAVGAYWLGLNQRADLTDD